MLAPFDTKKKQNGKFIYRDQIIGNKKEVQKFIDAINDVLD